jgi:predicted nucleotidyltransferase
MRSPLPTLAKEIGADQRTLRRAAQRGMVRCSRSGPRQLELDEAERDYLHSHWPLLSSLTRALRTEPNVRLAVLYGSAARGDDRPDSDVDLLVDLSEDRPDAGVKLALRLERALGRRVDVVRLGRVRGRSPLLVLQVLDEGRVLVDRDGRWPALKARRWRMAGAARRDRERARREAAESLRMLVEAES